MTLLYIIYIYMLTGITKQENSKSRNLQPTDLYQCLVISLIISDMGQPAHQCYFKQDNFKMPLL